MNMDNTDSHPVTVLITEHEYKKAIPFFEHAVTIGFRCLCTTKAEEDLAAHIRETGAKHVIIGVDDFTGPLYDALPEGGVIARFGVGYDGVDLKQATAKGLYCTNTPGVLDRSVAEHTITLINAAARHIAPLDKQLKNGEWNPVIGIELAGLRLAIIGCGRIGNMVAAIASRGLGMKVTGCDVRELDAQQLADECGIDRFTQSFEDAVSDADFVSLHLPVFDSTRHFINAERLAMLKPKTWLINASRGALIDEKPLYNALSSKSIAGAALDVYEIEPYQPVDPDMDLRALPNILMTPHVASSTDKACRRMAEGALDNIRRAEAGDFKTMNLLNPEVLS